MTDGDLTLHHSQGHNLDALLMVLRETEATVTESDDLIRIVGNGRPVAADITTDPFPVFRLICRLNSWP